jgi:hypothetical protein
MRDFLDLFKMKSIPQSNTPFLLALAFILSLIAFIFLIPTGSFAQSQTDSDFDASLTPVVQNAAYSSGNAIGGLLTITPFRSVSPTGILNNVSVWSKGGSTTAITFYIFHSNPIASTCNDKAAFVLDNADVNKLLTFNPPVLTPAIVGVGTTATTAAQQIPVSVRNQDVPSTTKLYICAVVGGTVTPASTSDLVFNFSGIRD